MKTVCAVEVSGFLPFVQPAGMEGLLTQSLRGLDLVLIILFYFWIFFLFCGGVAGARDWSGFTSMCRVRRGTVRGNGLSLIFSEFSTGFP